MKTVRHGQAFTVEPMHFHEYAALLLFQSQYGRHWKAALRRMWERSEYYQLPEWAAVSLHVLRNMRGPSWLARYRLGV